MSAFMSGGGLGRDVLIPSTRRLAADEVAVWLAALDESSDDVMLEFADLLSADEVERASRFFFPRDRRRFVVGRGILRVLLGAYNGVAPRDLRFVYGPNGKPALATTGGAGEMGFNLAHSDGLAVFAFAGGGDVGVDLERVREMADWRRIAELSFPVRDCLRVKAASEERRMTEFFRAWTRQEALLKATGAGLGGALPPSGRFRVQALALASGFIGALAVGRGVRVVSHHMWSDGEFAGLRQRN